MRSVPPRGKSATRGPNSAACKACVNESLRMI